LGAGRVGLAAGVGERAGVGAAAGGEAVGVGSFTPAASGRLARSPWQVTALVWTQPTPRWAVSTSSHAPLAVDLRAASAVPAGKVVIGS